MTGCYSTASCKRETPFFLQTINIIRLSDYNTALQINRFSKTKIELLRCENNTSDE